MRRARRIRSTAEIDAGATGDTAQDTRPRVAGDGTGAWVAVWETRGGPLGDDYVLLVARSTDGGVSWGPAVALDANAAADTGRSPK